MTSPRPPNAGGESKLGDLIADAQLADPSVVTGGDVPTIAFMNPGGIRTNLTYANSPWGEAPGAVTYEEAFTVQPFNNYLVSMTLTGAQIKEILLRAVGRRHQDVAEHHGPAGHPAGVRRASPTATATPPAAGSSARSRSNGAPISRHARPTGS